MAAPRRDFAVTLVDGRRVVGRYHDDAGERSAYVHPPERDGPILGSGTAGTLAQAGLSAMTPGRRSAAPASSCGCLPAIPGARRPRIRRGDRHFPIGRRERAQGRRVRGRSWKGATAMPHPSSGSPSPASRTPRFERPAWDAALRPAQRRAGLGRARLERRPAATTDHGLASRAGQPLSEQRRRVRSRAGSRARSACCADGSGPVCRVSGVDEADLEQVPPVLGPCRRDGYRPSRSCEIAGLVWDGDRSDAALEPDPTGLHVANREVILDPVLIVERVDVDVGARAATPCSRPPRRSATGSRARRPAYGRSRGRPSRGSM